MDIIKLIENISGFIWGDLRRRRHHSGPDWPTRRGPSRHGPVHDGPFGRASRAPFRACVGRSLARPQGSGRRWRHHTVAGAFDRPVGSGRHRKPSRCGHGYHSGWTLAQSSGCGLLPCSAWHSPSPKALSRSNIAKQTSMAASMAARCTISRTVWAKAGAGSRSFSVSEPCSPQWRPGQ